MRSYYKFILLLFILSGLTNYLHAQCSGGVAGGTITPTLAWQTVGATSIAGGTYRTFNATAGNTYYFSFCSTDGGSSTFDTQISINNNLGATVAGVYNDDFCGVQSYVAWTCVTAGTYSILVNLYNCGSSGKLVKLAYKLSPAVSCP